MFLMKIDILNQEKKVISFNYLLTFPVQNLLKLGLQYAKIYGMMKNFGVKETMKITLYKTWLNMG